MLKKYFNKPVLFDYVVITVLIISVYILWHKGIISTPNNTNLISIATDIANISLTATGFILTLLTIIITFKGSSTVTKENYNPEEHSVFEAFINTSLYSETINILKGAIKSLIFVALLGYILKLSLNDRYFHVLFFYNIGGLFIIVSSLLRSLFILNKIIEWQNE